VKVSTSYGCTLFQFSRQHPSSSFQAIASSTGVGAGVGAGVAGNIPAGVGAGVGAAVTATQDLNFLPAAFAQSHAAFFRHFLAFENEAQTGAGAAAGAAVGAVLPATGGLLHVLNFALSTRAQSHAAFFRHLAGILLNLAQFTTGVGATVGADVGAAVGTCPLTVVDASASASKRAA
jgi:hypothetical protein